VQSLGVGVRNLQQWKVNVPFQQVKVATLDRIQIKGWSGVSVNHGERVGLKPSAFNSGFYLLASRQQQRQHREEAVHHFGLGWDSLRSQIWLW